MTTEKKLTLKDVNKSLYDALLKLWESATANAQKVAIHDTDFGYIADTLDELEVKYFGEEPDGSYQQELAEDGEPMFTDQQAYVALIVRLNNTRIDFNAKGWETPLD